MNLRRAKIDRYSVFTKRFLVGVFLNGLGNGIFGVIWQLYLTSIELDICSIIRLYLMNALGTTLLTIPLGICANNYGNRRMFLFSFSLIVISSSILITNNKVEMLALALFILGIYNATTIVWTAVYSSFFQKDEMNQAFGVLDSLNIIALSIGSLSGFIPQMLVALKGFNTQISYWILLVLAAVFLSIAPLFFIRSLQRETENQTRKKEKFHLKSKRTVGKFCLITLLGQFGLGIFLNFFPFYAFTKFGMQSDVLGCLFFISYLVSAVANIVSHKISKRLGQLETIVTTIGFASLSYLLIPLAPNVLWLCAFYVARIGFRMMANPCISSLFISLIKDEENITANSIISVVSQSSNLIVYSISDQVANQYSLDFPAFLGASIYSIYALSYYFLLQNERT